jgi:hypothetical protein
LLTPLQNSYVLYRTSISNGTCVQQVAYLFAARERLPRQRTATSNHLQTKCLPREKFPLPEQDFDAALCARRWFVPRKC